MSLATLQDELEKLAARQALTFAALTAAAPSAGFVLAELPPASSVTLDGATFNLSAPGDDQILTITASADWESLIGLPVTITLAADASTTDGYLTTIEFQMPAAATLGLPGLERFSVNGFKFGGSSVPGSLAKTGLVPPAEIYLAAMLEFKGSQTSTLVPIHIADDGMGEFKLTLDTSNAKLPGINDALTLFDGVTSDIHLPKTVQDLLNFSLLDLSVTFQPDTESVTEIALSLANSAQSNNGGWQIIPNILALNRYRIDLNVADPFGTPQTSGVIDAQTMLGAVALNVAALHPVSGGWDFQGYLGQGAAVSMSDIVAGLGQQFGVTLPDVLHKFTLRKFNLRFNTDTGNASGGFVADFTAGETAVDLTIDATLEKQAAGYQPSVNGKFVISSAEFEVEFSDQANASFRAAWSDADNPLDFADVARCFGWTNMPAVPESLDLSLIEAIFDYDFTARSLTFSAHSAHYGQLRFVSNFTQSGQKQYLCALDLPLDVGLTNLPVVGDKLPSDLRIKNLQLIFASADISPAELAAMNALFAAATDNPLIPQSLAAGVTLATVLQAGGEQQPLVIALSGTSNASTLTPDSPAKRQGLAHDVASSTAAPTYQADATWFAVDKTFEAASLQRIGFQYQTPELAFLLDAALSAAGLTLTLEGLSVGTPLNKFAPHFDLHGLGVDYSNGGVEIGGAFLRTQVQSNGQAYDEYDGAVVIKTDEFQLSALGSYAQLNGQPSLFVYALLDYPIGGPAFFFVTGLTAGFGYNRALNVPAVGEVAQFPLVAEAVAGSGTPNDLTAELQTLQSYIPPVLDEVFLAIGIKFTSFKMIDSFALLTFSFGTRFEINVLGLSTMIVPTPEEGVTVTPLAEVQMAVRASFVPDDGFLGVSAQLTNASYILSKDCHLTGGYAFYSWFKGEHAGDFVQTLGGYHPAFNVPAHYPQVPRLGLNWQISEQLSIKGGLYYALTASTLMAGGYLQAVWEDGDLKAWFNAGADFLIAWKPYHYDAQIYVDMGVSYSFSFFGRHQISVDVGASLHIWGPEFSGTAHIKLWIVSFDVSFGGGSAARPQPIGWDELRQSFLPANEDVCGIVVQAGLVGRVAQDSSDLGVINPKEFALATHSAIPANHAYVGNLTAIETNQYSTAAGSERVLLPFNTAAADNATMHQVGQIGIGSMGLAPTDLISTHTVSITRDGTAVETDFAFTPILKNIPAGLWGDALLPDLNAEGFIAQAFDGFVITPQALTLPGETKAIKRSSLQYAAPQIMQNAYAWETIGAFTPAAPDNDAANRAAISASIQQSQIVAARTALLQTLGFSANDSIDLAATVADSFLIAPQIEAPVS